MTSGRAGSERVSFPGAAGALEGLWLPAGVDASARLVVLCHPHPLHGGTMETKLVVRVARRLAEAGVQTLRFNFRGVGASAGAWADGVGEREDVSAALDYAVGRLPGARVALFGMSFGALVGLDVGARDSRVEVLVGVVPPVRLFPPDFLAGATKAKLIVAAGRDEVVDPAALMAWVRRLPSPMEHLLIEDADHLFGGFEAAVADAVVAFLDRTMPAAPEAQGRRGPDSDRL